MKNASVEFKILLWLFGLFFLTLVWTLSLLFVSDIFIHYVGEEPIINLIYGGLLPLPAILLTRVAVVATAKGKTQPFLTAAKAALLLYVSAWPAALIIDLLMFELG